ncbi:pyridoxamine 5'-phosphate oxidase [Mangrovactinospora gilvigrisea]|uniref:Pyridoxamine 5'-phosphate oxidase n=1 Tax=Mangrovactinospora gilvigrisea TaxID=1428644 RepID=A0A1J7BAN6_9ACTN|nr:pyridoxamine 5'-phosphate oxidase family protein [Mangrovactinospora gilvigrisea]OIV35759.1 pyridoxamine 5'-phosphate oxidase [Mangrovactinospora gilvigrisea]
MPRSEPGGATHSDVDVPGGGPGRNTEEMAREEALRLLGSVPFGRVVFTLHALPAIRPVNHLLEDGAILIRTHAGAELAEAARRDEGRGTVVAYEADSLDAESMTGWSVVVTGYLRPVTDPVEEARLRERLHPWVDRDMDRAVRIDPDLVTGYRLRPR